MPLIRKVVKQRRTSFKYGRKYTSHFVYLPKSWVDFIEARTGRELKKVKIDDVGEKLTISPYFKED